MISLWIPVGGPVTSGRRQASGAGRMLAGTLLAVLVAASSPTALLAHAELLRSEPVAGAVLASAPTRVRLWFSEPVDPPLDAVIVVGPDGVRVDRHDTRATPGDEGGLDASLYARVQGTYTVRWRAISADSHPISGEFRFSLGHVSDTTVPEVTAAGSGPREGTLLQAVARWLHLLGLALFVGPLALLILSAPTSDLRALEPSLWRGSAWGTLLLVAACLASWIAQSAAVAGSLADGLRSDALIGLLHTRWGTLWMARCGLVLAAVAATHAAARRAAVPGRLTPWRSWLSLGVAAGLIASTALNSHAAATKPVWLSLGVDWVHVAAAVVWIGGLFGLTAIVLPTAYRLAPERRQAALARLVSRFSPLALVSVELLVITGLYHTWAHVSDPEALMSTPYGRMLLIKLLLVGAMLLPAAFNLLVARPRLASARSFMTGREARRFRHAVGMEAVLGGLVLATVGLLTSLPPAQTVSAASNGPGSPVLAAPAVTVAAPAGKYLVTLTVGPGRVGSNHVEARVQDERRIPITNAQLKLHIIPPRDSQIPPWVVTPAPDGDHYQATVALAPGGRWRVDVEVTMGVETSSTGTFSFSVPLLGAGELLATATERMNSLRSVHEETDTLVDGVHETVQADHLAPLDYRWLDSATEVALIGRDTVDNDECFEVAYVDTQDGARVRVWIATQTLLVLQRASAVPGRVLVSRFSRFVGGPPRGSSHR